MTRTGSPRRWRPAPSVTCSRTASPRELLAAIRSAAPGPAPLDPRVARALLPRPPRTDAGDALSAREREVLELVAKGLANKQIGRTLGITERTVKVHVGNVFRRIGVADRTSAAFWARENLPAAPRAEPRSPPHPCGAPAGRVAVAAGRG